MEKKLIRKEMLKIRDAIPQDIKGSKSSEICRMILGSEEYRNAEALYTYIPYRGEVDIMPVIQDAWNRGNMVAVPRVNGEGIMEFHSISSMDDLEEGYKGILEPYGSMPIVHPGKSALMLTPGVAFTPDGGRMGYGKGFYDRYLARFPGTVTFGIGYEEQILQELPREDTDILLCKILYA